MSAPTDPERLRQILEAEDIATADAGPSLTAWLSDVIDRAVAEAFDASLPMMGASAPWLAGAILLAAAVLAVGIVVALVLGLTRRPRAGAPGPEATPLPVAGPPPSLADVERLLGQGDAHAALVALWRWVAAGIEARGYARPRPDRTNRELLAEVRGAAPGWDRLPAFARLTNAVDAHLYGGVALDVAAVRALVPLAQQVAQ